VSLHEEALGLPKSESCEAIGLGRDPRAVSDGTTLLFGLPGVRVVRVERRADGTRVVQVVTARAVYCWWLWVWWPHSGPVGSGSGPELNGLKSKTTRLSGA
jgi:hypothetical protein